jgi:hypothetical protein
MFCGIRGAMGWFLLFGVVSGCAGTVASSDGATTLDGTDGTALPDRPDGSPPDVGVGVDTDPSGPELPPQMCFADFPCRPGNRYRCDGTPDYVVLETHECHYSCGPGPCSGESCDPTGPHGHCAAGEQCVADTGSPGDLDAGPLMPCHPIADAGADATVRDATDATDVTDATASDACVPRVADLAASGHTCAGAGTGDCPAGYTCHPDEGVVLALTCRVLCALDCECPASARCVEMADKVSHWHECEHHP